jgi:RNA polymerase-binding transcription factor DksA
MSLCNRCGDEIILTKLNMVLAKPHCEDCTRKRKESTADKLKDLIEAMEMK